MTKKIYCPLLLQQEKEIQILTDRINQCKIPQEKVQIAHELLQKVRFLLNCNDFKDADVDCSCCRTIAKLREETANLVLKAGKFSQK